MNECTKEKPDPKARTHNNVVEYMKITVNAGKVVRCEILKCLDCGLEIR